jgi:uncharacterized protein involved in outer membrane biogenesis
MVRRLTLLALIGAVLTVLGLTPLPLGGSNLPKGVRQQIEAATGFSPVSHDAPRLLLLPRPHLRAGNLILHESAQDLSIPMREFQGAIRFLPILAGRLELAAMHWEGPVLFADSPEKRQLWASAINRAFAHDGSFLRKRTRELIGNLSINAGRVLLKPQDDRSVIEALQLSIDWNGEGLLGADVNLNWRDKPLAIAFRRFNPAMFWEENRAPAVLSVRSEWFDLDFDGDISGSSQPEAYGRLVFDIRSVSAVLDWFDLRWPVASFTKRLKARGQGVFDTQRFAFSDGRFDTDAGRLDGRLTLGFNLPRPALLGTLHAAVLDLTSMLEPASALLRMHVQEPGRPVPRDMLTGHDLDLRLSAQHVAIGEVSLQDLAMTAILQNGHGDVTIGQAQVQRGNVRGRFMLNAATETIEAKANATWEKLPLSMSLPLFGLGRSALTSTGQAQIESIGTVLDGMLRTLSGRMTLSVQDGEIVIINLPDLLRKIGQSVSFSIRGNRLALTQLNGTITIANGTLDLQTMRLEGNAASMLLSGVIRPFSGTLDLAARLTSGTQTWPFRISGRVLEPVFSPLP